uniref:Uncharacterized protein n=1 Tax=Anguilla anguilla TaxID=7936 RepID=A0A0E9VEI9_ANGAN
MFSEVGVTKSCLKGWSCLKNHNCTQRSSRCAVRGRSPCLFPVVTTRSPH